MPRAARGAGRAAPSPWAELDAPLLHACFALLPVDALATCACVCRAWRAGASAGALWQRVDMSATTGGLRRPPRLAALRGAMARATGHLQALDLTGNLHNESGMDDELLLLLPRHAATLRELRVGNLGGYLGTHMFAELLRAAPALTALYGEVSDSPAQLLPLVRREPPFGPLRLQGLCPSEGGGSFVEVLAAAPAHAELRSLWFRFFDMSADGAADALADAVLASRVQTVGTYHSALSAAAVPGLVRLLGSRTLAALTLDQAGGEQLLTAEGGAALGEALRANSTLTTFSLSSWSLWRPDPAGAIALLAALRGHPTLRRLELMCSDAGRAAKQVGEAVGQIIAANAPALRSLKLVACGLGDAGLAPVAAALRRNSHLEHLEIFNNNMTARFAATQLLDAVMACPSLRDLHDNTAENHYGRTPAALFVKRRAARAAAAGEADAPSRPVRRSARRAPR
jgi:hypothetical protein